MVHGVVEEGRWWLESQSWIVESFSEVTILRLSPVPKHWWVISSSEWKTSQKFSRLNHCFILHWESKSKKKKRRRLVLLSLKTMIYHLISSQWNRFLKKISSMPCMSFLECYLPIIVKVPKQKLAPTMCTVGVRSGGTWYRNQQVLHQIITKIITALLQL